MLNRQFISCKMITLSVSTVCFLCFLPAAVFTVSAYGNPILNTSPEAFPFHAAVRGKQIICNGVLISEKFVLTPAYCVNGSQNVSVFMGYRGHPNFSSNKGEPSTKIVHSNKITIHEGYEDLGDSMYLNNLALVELPEAIASTSTIKPGRLISANDLPILPRSSLNITGWYAKEDTNMKIGRVALREQDACRYLFGRSFFEDQELCVKWESTKPLNYLGNPVSFNGKIIGYLTKTPPCLGKSGCTRSDVFLNIVPFLKWISHHTNNSMPIAENDHDYILERLIYLEREMERLQLNQTTLGSIYRGTDRTEGYGEPEIK